MWVYKCIRLWPFWGFNLLAEKWDIIETAF